MANKVFVSSPVVSVYDLCSGAAVVDSVGGDEVLPVRRPAQPQHTSCAATLCTAKIALQGMR